MSISVICACKNRSEALRVSLSSWLNFKEITEIIIIDWSSDEPIDYFTKLDSRIKIIRVSDQKYFNQPQPLNLAASLATGKYILKLDTDYVINPYHNFILSYFPSDDSFTSGVHNYENPEYYDETIGQLMFNKHLMSSEELKNYFDSYSPYFKYLTGLLFITKENFDKVGGYNEKLTSCYAYEDDEIFQRLRLLGLKENKLDVDFSLIHLPHGDNKRTENFKGFEGDDKYIKELRDNLGNYYSGNDLEWQVEYALSQKHINENKEMIGDINHYYTEPITSWNIIQMNEQNYLAEMKTKELKGFPKVYYLSLEECENRRKDLEQQFSKYNIKPISIISKRFSESNDNITGKYLYQLNDGTKGCCVSHLKAIQQWYNTTDEDYAFFCEDDLSLETIDYWNFTWEDFINSLPEDAECVQLFTIRDHYDTYELRERYWNDWGASAYILTRDYAKKIIETYIQGDTYHLEIPNQDVMPLIENILFASVGKTYTIPLFVENTKFNSTFVNQDDDVNEGQKNNHRIAKDLVLNYWKNKKQNNNEKTELEQLLYNYALDPENAEHNFNLGLWYEKEGHSSPSASYFLRCAERAEDKDLAYEALIRCSYCYQREGDRDGTSRGMLFQAQAFRPDRPEAYFLLSRYAEKREWWQDCYLNAHLALLYCDFNQPPLRTNVEYPGKYGLLFEKALSGWWWGKTEESKSLFKQILEFDNVLPNYIELVKNNLKLFKDEPIVENVKKQEPKVEKDFNFKEDFDWGDLTYEDIITIEREIIHEKVYRHWRDVKEDDVVVDIGSSVGPFICSILENKPSKVYCVEPSKTLIKTLAKNCSEYLLDYPINPLIYINKGIVSNTEDKINIFGNTKEFDGITFKQMITDYHIDKINFLKIDCEGGEYNIFKEENMNFLLNNVEFIAMEVHLNYENCRDKFKTFRDKYLTQFKDYQVMSCTRQNMSWGISLDIKDKIFDNNFVDNYTCEFMIYIYNKNNER
jgi:hypothetical protein